MQQIERYTPNHPELGLIRYDAADSISDSVNPLYYSLSPLDFDAVTINGELLYSLDEDIGRALLCTLKRLARFICTAGNVYKPRLTPGPLPLTIPTRLLDEINMPFPDILHIESYYRANPLFMLTSPHKLRAMYKGFQALGQDAVHWIEEANLRSRGLGDGTGWDWDLASCRRTIGYLTYPNRQLIRYENPERALVLHPVHSQYAADHPDFNPFELDVDGYVDLCPAPPPTKRSLTPDSDFFLSISDDDVEMEGPTV